MERGKIRAARLMAMLMLSVLLLSFVASFGTLAVSAAPESTGASLAIEKKVIEDSTLDRAVSFHYTVSFSEQKSIQEKIPVQGKIVLLNGGNINRYFPQQLKVYLCANEKPVRELQPNEIAERKQSYLKYVFEGVDKYDANAKEINYSVSLNKIPDGFDYVISGLNIVLFEKGSVNPEAECFVGCIDRMLAEDGTTLTCCDLTIDREDDSCCVDPDSCCNMPVAYPTLYQAAVETVPVNAQEVNGVALEESPSADPKATVPYNLSDYAYSNAVSKNSSFSKIRDGYYSFSLRAGETLTISDLPEGVSFTLTETGAQLNGKTYTMLSEDRSVRYSMSPSSPYMTYNSARGIIARNNVAAVFLYSGERKVIVPDKTITVWYRESETEELLQEASDSYTVKEKDTITIEAKVFEGYQLISEPSKTLADVMEDQEIHFTIKK